MSPLEISVLKGLTDHPHVTMFVVENAGNTATRANVYHTLVKLARGGFAKRHDRKTMYGTQRHPKWSITDKGREARQ